MKALRVHLEPSLRLHGRSHRESPIRPTLPVPTIQSQPVPNQMCKFSYPYLVFWTPINPLRRIKSGLAYEFFTRPSRSRILKYQIRIESTMVVPYFLGNASRDSSSLVARITSHEKVLPMIKISKGGLLDTRFSILDEHRGTSIEHRDSHRHKKVTYFLSYQPSSYCLLYIERALQHGCFSMMQPK